MVNHDHCRAIKDILPDQEVFVDYGPEYAAELGIDPSTFDTYTRPENHKTVAIPCPSCDTPFSAQHFLDAHLLSCRKKMSSTPGEVGNKQAPVVGKIQCTNSTCVKLFSTKGAMMQHNRRVHLGEFKFSCTDPLCSKVFGFKSGMLRHYKTVHLEQKPYKCITCGQLFQFDFDLKRHVDAVHLGKRPFICGDCGATFAQADNLKTHVTSQHSAMPPRYVCTHPGCSSSFTSKPNLKLHMMDHTGERPFPCPYERFVRFCVAIFFQCWTNTFYHV